MNVEEKEDRITQAQIHQYQVESPDEWNARIKAEAKNQPVQTDFAKPKKWWEKNSVRAVGASALLGIAAIAAWVSCDGKNPPIVPPPTPSPIPTQRPTELPTVLPSATASPTSTETATPIPTATEQPKWQPHFSEDATLREGETFWSNSYNKAVSYLQTFYSEEYFTNNGDKQELTEEGDRIAGVMADGSTLIVLLENNISLEEARNLSNDLPYQGPSNDTMTIMYEGVLGQPEYGLADPNEPTQFINLAQKVNFMGEQLTDEEINATQHLIADLNALEESQK